jgi:hypothetical protein
VQQIQQGVVPDGADKGVGGRGFGPVVSHTE